MRRLYGLVFIWGILLVGCGSPTQNNAPTTGTTGATENKVPFITNGDTRVDDALKAEPQGSPPVDLDPPQKAEPQPQPKPQPPKVAPSDEIRNLSLRLAEFEISRFSAHETKPSRFGNHHVIIKIFLEDEAKPIVFTGPFSGSDNHYTIDLKQGRYSLSGKFDDTPQDKVDGDLTLVDHKNHDDSAHIFYDAYTANLTVSEDTSQPIAAGSSIEQQLKALKDNTFGWVHNWKVVKGRAFYLVDIVKRVDGNTLSQPAPLIAFKGESLQTGDQDHPATSLTPNFTDSVALIGNSETVRRRWFETRLADPKTKEESRVILDVQAATPTPQEQTFDDVEEPEEDNSQSADDGEEQQPQPPPQQEQPQVRPPQQAPPQQQPPVHPTTPRPLNPPPSQQQQQQPLPRSQPPSLHSQPHTVAPTITGSSYLVIDNSLRRTAIMSNDFARNFNLRSVRGWMKAYTDPRNSRHKGLMAFYKYANPFRHLIEAIGRSFDVSPSYSYLTVIESPYFTGGRYHISGNNVSSALGPFQILDGTAGKLNLRVGGRNDERHYFAPSACAAAKYIGQLVEEFDGSDATLAILGYYQGDGGAARAIACTYADRSQCYGKNYSRYKTLVKNYKFKYADIDQVAAIPKDQRDYVDRKLAIYFVSSDMNGYGLSIPQDAPRSLTPAAGTVFPSQTIWDARCRNTVQPFEATN